MHPAEATGVHAAAEMSSAAKAAMSSATEAAASSAAETTTMAAAPPPPRARTGEATANVAAMAAATMPVRSLLCI
ncbi:hypothetical protein NK6_5910 [Bradyrhizobium diazoefficiens]|uniref:Uncharacterized protein n=1 Tax=Bradyrhizobium diazoefficiens TaxID=1355477 RepID=A0A0E3VVF4_9BRAD|nr:hypothetical protein NK6_5910 [Bradyrhizobium diazoefficiens]